MKRTRHIALAIVGSVGGRAATLLAPFFVMPAMLIHLGDRDFGIWVTAIAITSVAQFADLGIGSGLLTRLSAAFARDDKANIRRDITNAYTVLTAISVPMFLLGLVGMVTLWPSVSPIYGAVFVAFAVTIPASVIQRVLYASQQVVRANLWQMAAAGISVAAAFWSIYAGFSAAAVVLSYAIITPVTMIAAALLTFSARREIAPHWSYVSLDSTRDLMGIGSRFLILSVLTATAMSADNILIALQLGEAAVTDYAVPARIGSLLTLVVVTLMMPLWPTYGDAIARHELSWVWRNVRQMALLGLTAVVAVGAVLIAFIDPILMLWMGRKFENAQWIIAGLATFAAVTAIAAPFNMVLNASGATRSQIIAWSLFLPLALVAKWLLLAEFGVWMLPLVDAIFYALVILPAMAIVARKTLQPGQSDLPEVTERP